MEASWGLPGNLYFPLEEGQTWLAADFPTSSSCLEYDVTPNLWQPFCVQRERPRESQTLLSYQAKASHYLALDFLKVKVIKLLFT